MKLRLMGTPAEVEAAVVALGEVFDVLDVSQPFPCRPPSQSVRVYLKVRVTDGQPGGVR